MELTELFKQRSIYKFLFAVLTLSFNFFRRNLNSSKSAWWRSERNALRKGKNSARKTGAMPTTVRKKRTPREFTRRH